MSFTGKNIDVKEQPIVGLRRTFGLALSGVRYRLFRAIVTVAVIAVAMAFLMNILSESLIKKTVAKVARDEIAQMRHTDKWIARLSVPQTPEQALFSLSKTNELAKQGQQYIDFFAKLNYARRRILVGSAEGTRIFDTLQDTQAQEDFIQALGQMKGIRFATSPADFSKFLTDWPILKQQIKVLRETEASAIRNVHSQLQGRTLIAALKDVGGPFGDTIRAAGFELTDNDVQILTAQLQRMTDMRLVEDTINNIEIRQAIAARKDVMPGEVTIDMIWKMLKNTKAAGWYLEIMSEQNIASGDLNAERLTNLASLRARTRLLVAAERMTLETGEGFMGIGKRMSWLVFVSMLVCVVGITNAMLMSVTERFREIATLKCLGALDGFIMLVFLIEACVLGLAGGIVGSILGLIFGATRMLATFQSLLVNSFPAGSLVSAAISSILTGIILAAIAAVYPSFRAARLAPMEAMRIE